MVYKSFKFNEIVLMPFNPIIRFIKNINRGQRKLSRSMKNAKLLNTPETWTCRVSVRALWCIC